MRPKMRRKKLSSRTDRIIKEVKSLDNNPTITDEEKDRRIAALLDKAEDLVRRELDPAVREHLRDNPEKLAEWDEIMHMCDDLDEEDAVKPDISSSTTQ